MALNISPVHRNLHTRVTFLYLEFEDWFVVIGLAAFTNIFGRWLDRNIFGIPMNVFLQYIVPVLSVPFLMLFKYGKPHGYLPPAALETAAQLHIFHQRHLRVAVHSLEDLATDENGLVSRRDAAPPGAHVHEPGDHPEHGAWIVEAHIEVAADDPRLRDRRFDGDERPIGQPRVRVKEEEDLAARGTCARVHLARASAGALEQANAREARRHGHRRIPAAAIHQDDLGRGEARLEIGQQALQIGRFVEDGNDDADQESRRRRSLKCSAWCR